MYADDRLIPALQAAGLTVSDLRHQLPRNTIYPRAREWLKREVNDIKLICYHYDAQPLRPDADYDTVARYTAEARGHIVKDWGQGWHAVTITYHLKLDGAGVVYVLNDVEEVTWHASDANWPGLAVCLDLGEGQEPTEAQVQSAQVVADVLSTQCLEIPAGPADHWAHGELTQYGNNTACCGSFIPYVQRYRATGRMAEGLPAPPPSAPEPEAEPPAEPVPFDVTPPSDTGGVNDAGAEAAALTDSERAILSTMAALGGDAGSIEKWVKNLQTAADLGAALQEPRVPTRRRKQIGATLVRLRD